MYTKANPTYCPGADLSQSAALGSDQYLMGLTHGPKEAALSVTVGLFQHSGGGEKLKILWGHLEAQKLRRCGIKAINTREKVKPHLLFIYSFRMFP